MQLVEKATQTFLDWAAAFMHPDEHQFQRSRVLATRLGAHYRSDGLTEIAFWVPEVDPEPESSWTNFPKTHHRQIHTSKRVYLTAYTPLQPIDFRAQEQEISFRRDRLPLRNHKDFYCGVYSGMRAGTKDRAGTFYCLQYEDSQNELQTVGDVLAYSLPYGIFAPAELYDIDCLQQQRADLDYFSALPGKNPAATRVSPPRNILQLHVGTASQEGTLEGLTRIYSRIAQKIKNQSPLTPAEKNYIGYDAVQLLPIEPVAEYRTPNSSRPGFVGWDETSNSDAKNIKVCLRKPTTQNWGYDIVLHASSATNPSVLGSLRPDELVDFIATLHAFPTGPIQVIFDLVYGHSDNQAKAVLNRYFLQGSNMYGQDVNHQNPIVRAILLEMQRRKINTGADGIRVDGAQDFKFYNSISGQVEYDDEYLKEMSNVRQDINGYHRQLFAIFEDGRPWPAKGWEESSTYLDVIKKQPDAYQWGPLIFAHNTPSLNKFWARKWQRVCQIMDRGSHWISGCGNHDTVRRGTQVDPQADINWNLGQTLPAVLNNAYNNPAVTMLFYGFSPGVPMDFLNATMQAPWCFFRNTDDYYGLKVVAEEVGFLDWQIEPEFYTEPWAFARMKQFGMESYGNLRLFLGWLHDTVLAMEDNYDLESLADRCQQFLNSQVVDPPQISVQVLQDFAKAYMEDCHHMCNVARFSNRVDAQRSQFNLSLRQYRQAHPWLRENLTSCDIFSCLDNEESTVFYGLRTYFEKDNYGPREKIAVVTHMGGNTTRIDLKNLFTEDMTDWHFVAITPGLKVPEQVKDLTIFELQDGQGLLLECICD